MSDAVSNEPETMANGDSHRYAVGIDLGTTHCVLSYVDLSVDPDDVTHKVMPIAQLSAPGSVEQHEQLPSFIYQAHDSEFSEGDLVLPWGASASSITGLMAREIGSKTPIRLVASAKSWLCHGGVDRRSAFLPLNSPDDVDKISPYAASLAYLEHLHQAWNDNFPDSPLVEQDVTITVPASFDPAARELTVEAARESGIKFLTLLEEPQAALYSWINSSGDDWRNHVAVGDIVLVVDVGGGTTDLSLVSVTEEEGNLSLNRIAVGDHILLGGDNMDLALAYRVQAKLAEQGKNLQPWQIQAITHACRDAKEILLSDASVDAVPIVVPNRGSKLLGATLSTELARDEVQQALVEGFFPEVTIDQHPVQQARGALTQIGLPYAQDAGISKHLAAFLCRHHDALTEGAEDADGFIQPTAIIFNGGVLKSSLLSERMLAIINRWLASAGAEPAKLLEGADLDLAVATGASYYGHVRRGKGVRIRGGIASSYYVGIESAMPAIPGMAPPVQALCVAPFGMEEGTGVDVPSQEFGLVVGEPVNLRFFGSSTRRDDAVGTLLDYWDPEELQELPALQISLPAEGRQAGDVVPIRLAARVTEVGTLRLEAIPREGEERWHIEFDVGE
jgi:molecular chaperone DnaK (HSP70)